MQVNFGDQVVIYSVTSTGYLTIGPPVAQNTGPPIKYYSQIYTNPSTQLPVVATITSSAGTTGPVTPNTPFGLVATGFPDGSTRYLSPLILSSVPFAWSLNNYQNWRITSTTNLIYGTQNSLTATFTALMGVTYTNNPVIFYSIATYCALNPSYPLTNCPSPPGPSPPGPSPPGPSPPGPSPPGPSPPGPSPPGQWWNKYRLWIIIGIIIFIIIILIIIIIIAATAR